MSAPVVNLIEIEFVVSKLRYLVWKKQRYLEDPAHNPPPDPDEEKYLHDQLQRLQEAYPEDFESNYGSDVFWNGVDRYLAKIANKWKTKKNTPPPDVLQANVKELEELRSRQETPAEIKFSSSATKYFGFGQQDSSALAKIITAHVADAPEFAAKEAVQVLDEVQTLQDKPVEPMVSTVLISTTSTDYQTSSDRYAAIVEFVSTETELPMDSVVVTSTAFATFSQTSVSYTPELTPAAEAAIVAVSDSVAQATEITQTLESKHEQLTKVTESAATATSVAQEIESAVRHDLDVSGPVKSAPDAAVVTKLFQYSAPLVLPAYKDAEVKIKDPEKLSTFKSFLLRLAIENGQQGGMSLSGVAEQLIGQTPFDRFFRLAKTTSFQKFTASQSALAQQLPSTGKVAEALLIASTKPEGAERDKAFLTTAVPSIEAKYKQLKKIEAFLKDFAELDLEHLDFADLANVISTHFGPNALKHLDAKLDQYFTKNKDQLVNPSLMQARMQNWAGDLIAKFVPAAQPIVAVLKPLNKAFFLVFDKLFGPSLTWIGRKIRSGLWKNFLAGAMVGIPVGIAFGATAGIISGITISLLTPQGAIAVPSAAIGAATAAATAALASFLAVTAVVVISIPVILAFVLFIINSSAYVVPAGIAQPSSVFTGTGGSVCGAGNSYEHLSFANTAGNPVASRAWQIVDGLSCGFWGYWNRSKLLPDNSNAADAPFYPELFDEANFAANPNHCVYAPNNPDGCTGDYHNGINLFWCTWLILKSYNESGIAMPLLYNGLYMTSAEVMHQWFIGQGRFISAADALKSPTTKVRQGDTVLVQTGSNTDRAGHVDMVWQVTADSIITIDSNAGLKSLSYTITDDKTNAYNGSMRIIGFGKQQ